MGSAPAEALGGPDGQVARAAAARYNPALPTGTDSDPGREVVWRQRGPDEPAPPQPATAAQARARLDAGNAAFAAVGREGGRHVVTVGPEAFGLPRTDGAGLPQEPFAAVLGCADARVPAELVFGQASNALFVVRVAGNVPGSECVGSLNYAMGNVPTVHLVIVLGHTQCGAVGAAVDALLEPQTYLQVVHDPALRAIVDSLLAGVRMAALALEGVHGPAVQKAPGYRAALVDVAVTANAAVTATVLNQAIHCDVGFGVFELQERTVGVPGVGGWNPGLADPPADDAALAILLRRAAAIAV